MPTQALQLLGYMDYDTPNEVWVPGRHKTARNIIFKGPKGNKRAEIIPGTREIINSSLPATGTNVCIGRYWDSVKKRVFYFNFNSAGYHGIYIINNDESINTLIQTGVNTTGDPLGFLATVTIDSVDIFYGDSTIGDIIYFCDSLLRPTKINVNRFLAGTYNPIVRSYIDVAKAPPQMPIKCTYENDTTVNSNNLRNSLFQFIYRYWYDDNDKSVWSTASIVPLPNQPSLQLAQSDYTLNSRISIFIPTGPSNVTQIEVAFRYVKDGVVSSYFLISSFIKANLSLADNDIYWFKFYNDSNYIPILEEEQVLLQSLVPQKAGTQALLNGNVIAYGNITEGYDPVTPVLSVTPNYLSGQYMFDFNGLLFFATISGVDSGAQGTTMKIYLFGTGTNTAGAVTTLNNAQALFFINCVDGSNTAKGMTYNNGSDSLVVATGLAGVSTNLVANGWTQVSLVGNVLTMSYPSAITLLTSGTKTGGGGANFNTATYQLQPQSNYNYGIMYFDAYGKTNGAIVSAGGSFTTPANNGNMIYASMSIGHLPPSWAVYYQIVRSPNLTYANNLFWVTNGAFSDAQANILGLRYAYLEIDNINQYNDQIQASEGVVSYSFTPGDRVRIYGRFNADSSTATLGAVYDYEVLGTVNSVIINGIVKTGTFIKIYYPTADITSNFKFDGTQNFMSYQIQVYGYTKHAVDNNQTYFEFGRCYGIGNAGTATAYHIGIEQSQVVSGGVSSQPALIGIMNGDYFNRTRTVPIGQSYSLTSAHYSNGFGYISLGWTLNGGTSPITNSLYTVQTANQTSSNTLYPGDYTSANSPFLNLSSTTPITVRVRMSVPVSLDANGQTSTGVILQAVASSGAYTSVVANNGVSMVSGTSYNIVVDSYITIPPLNHLKIIITNASNFVNQQIGSTNLILDVIESVTIPIYETSFSDVYSMKINSNGRPSVYDPNAKQITNGVLFRFSRPYEPDTNINGMSYFFPENQDEFSKDFGSIVRMIVHQRELRIYQQIRVGVTGIYARYIKDQQGNNNLVTTDAIITPNNIQYYIGDFGLGNQPGGIISSGNVDWFYYVNKGYLCRLSQDGITPISDLYHMQTWAGANISAYNTDSSYQFGGKAKLLGTINYLKDRHPEVIFMLQGASDKTPYTLSWDEEENQFGSFYDYNCDQIICAGNKLFMFWNGRVFVQDNTSTNANFFGTQYKPSIDLVFGSDQPNIKKEFSSVGYTSPIQNLLPPTVPIWESPTVGHIKTSLGQQSALVYQNFDARENFYYSGFWRNAVYSNVYNIYDIVSGDYLKGLWLQMHLQCNTYGFTWMYSPFVNYRVSQKVL